MIRKLFLLSLIILTSELWSAGTNFKKVNFSVNKNESNTNDQKNLFTIYLPDYKYQLTFSRKKGPLLCDPMNDQTPAEFETIGEKECDATSGKQRMLIPYKEGEVTDIFSIPIVRVEYPKVYYSAPPSNIPASFLREIEFPAVLPNGSFRIRTAHETECLAGGWCYQDGEYDPQGTYGIRNCSGDPDNQWFNYIIFTKTYRLFENEKGTISFCVYSTDKEVYTIVRNKDGFLVKDKNGEKISASSKTRNQPW